MARLAVGLVDERIVALNGFDAAFAIIQAGDKGVVLSKGRIRRANIGEEPSRITGMQVANGLGQHYGVTGGLAVAQYQLSYVFSHIRI